MCSLLFFNCLLAILVDSFFLTFFQVFFSFFFLEKRHPSFKNIYNAIFLLYRKCRKVCFASVLLFKFSSGIKTFRDNPVTHIVFFLNKKVSIALQNQVNVH